MGCGGHAGGLCVGFGGAGSHCFPVGVRGGDGDLWQQRQGKSELLNESAVAMEGGSKSHVPLSRTHELNVMDTRAQRRRPVNVNHVGVQFIS